MKEVRFVVDNQFTVYYLHSEDYEVVKKSELLPNLDLKLLTKHLIADYPLSAAIAFRKKIKMTIFKFSIVLTIFKK